MHWAHQCVVARKYDYMATEHYILSNLSPGTSLFEGHLSTYCRHPSTEIEIIPNRILHAVPLDKIRLLFLVAVFLSRP